MKYYSIEEFAEPIKKDFLKNKDNVQISMKKIKKERSMSKLRILQNLKSK